MIKNPSYQILESYQDRVSTTEFWDNGIIFIKLEDNKQIELEDSKQQFELLNSKFNGINKHLVLVEPGHYTDLSKEAREFSEKPESNAMTFATAVIIRSLAQRIIINFMINFIKHGSMKMKMFENKEQAVEWLLTLKQTQTSVS